MVSAQECWLSAFRKAGFGGETVVKTILKREQIQVITAVVMAIAVLAMIAGLGLSTGRAGAASPTQI